MLSIGKKKKIDSAKFVGANVVVHSRFIIWKFLT